VQEGGDGDGEDAAVDEDRVACVVARARIHGGSPSGWPILCCEQLGGDGADEGDDDETEDESVDEEDLFDLVAIARVHGGSPAVGGVWLGDTYRIAKSVPVADLCPVLSVGATVKSGKTIACGIIRTIIWIIS
jgi:hypothetical protein